ncbi:hypothetical protein H0H93_003735 [Arthromyces matolae]|nr:hypothetical protein H0H93_003735 [Arthromyces matolae]
MSYAFLTASSTPIPHPSSSDHHVNDVLPTSVIVNNIDTNWPLIHLVYGRDMVEMKVPEIFKTVATGIPMNINVPRSKRQITTRDKEVMEQFCLKVKTAIEGSVSNATAKENLRKSFSTWMTDLSQRGFRDLKFVTEVNEAPNDDFVQDVQYGSYRQPSPHVTGGFPPVSSYNPHAPWSHLGYVPSTSPENAPLSTNTNMVQHQQLPPISFLSQHDTHPRAPPNIQQSSHPRNPDIPAKWGP